MVDLALHVRIFDTNPSDDFVTKRAAALKELGGRWTKSRPVTSILQTANDLAAAVETKGKMSPSLSSEIEAAIRKSSEAFVAEGHGLELAVIGSLAMLKAFEEATATSGDATTILVLAVGLWSALGIQQPRSEPKFETLRAELSRAARQYVLDSATASRSRQKVPDGTVAAPSDADPANIAKAVNAGLKGTISTLRTNAAIDREEIDLLWWVVGDWSELLDGSYSKEPNRVAAAIASGIEAGFMMRRMPSEAHRHLVLRHVDGRTAPSQTLSEVLEAVALKREPLASRFSADATIMSCPAVFPLLHALAKGTATHLKSKQKYSLEEWASRALVETSALHVTSQLPVAV